MKWHINLMVVCLILQVLLINDFGQHLWDRIPPEEYEEPPKDWVPKDEKYRIEGEGISIGRKVVLRAKQAVDK